MVPVRRILAEKRHLVLPVAIALAANVLLFAVAVYPLSRRVAAAEQRAGAATRGLRIAQLRAAQARETVNGKARADHELQQFYKDVLPVDLAGARRITYLRLAQLAEQSNLRYERRTVAAERERDSPLTKLHMTMVLEGEYEDVRRFIYRLETSPEFVVIEDVSLAQGQEKGGALVLTLDVSTYFRNAGDGT
jgi:Tfp pilus assembly protein PilO